MGTMRLVVDAPGGGAPSEVDVERLGELLGDTRNRLWLDIGDPGPAEVALLHRVFGFHELALEEVTRARERPRCETYGGYYFIVVYAAESAGDSFLARELNLFWSENYLVTITGGRRRCWRCWTRHGAAGSTMTAASRMGWRRWPTPCSRAWSRATS
jgi:hypothetical protein